MKIYICLNGQISLKNNLKQRKKRTKVGERDETVKYRIKGRQTSIFFMISDLELIQHFKIILKVNT